MIVVEAGGVEALLVEQELDDQRRTARIGFEGFADLVFDGFRHGRMRNVVPDAWAAEQVFRPRTAGLGHVLLFDFAGMDDCRGFHSTREKECGCQKRQSEPAMARSLGSASAFARFHSCVTQGQEERAMHRCSPNRRFLRNDPRRFISDRRTRTIERIMPVHLDFVYIRIVADEAKEANC